jgi:hypothetical protein
MVDAHMHVSKAKAYSVCETLESYSVEDHVAEIKCRGRVRTHAETARACPKSTVT